MSVATQISIVRLYIFNTPKFREWSTNSMQNRQSFAWLNVCSHHKQWTNHVSRLTCFQSKRYCLKSSKLHSEINSLETHNNAHEQRKWCFCPKFHGCLPSFLRIQWNLHWTIPTNVYNHIFVTTENPIDFSEYFEWTRFQQRQFFSVFPQIPFDNEFRASAEMDFPFNEEICRKEFLAMRTNIFSSFRFNILASW